MSTSMPNDTHGNGEKPPQHGLAQRRRPRRSGVPAARNADGMAKLTCGPRGFTVRASVGEATAGIWVATATSGDTACRSAVLVESRHELVRCHRPAMLKLERWRTGGFGWVPPLLLLARIPAMIAVVLECTDRKEVNATMDNDRSSDSHSCDGHSRDSHSRMQKSMLVSVIRPAFALRRRRAS